MYVKAAEAPSAKRVFFHTNYFLSLLVPDVLNLVFGIRYHKLGFTAKMISNAHVWKEFSTRFTRI